MPVTIQLTGLKYKNSQGQFQSADCLKGEDADISIIAPDYSELTFPVNAGKLCTHDLKLYRAKQGIPTSENWTESHWDERTIEEELAAKYTKPAGGIPASDLADGVIPDIIDDEAGAGDTDVTFSADKLTTDLFSLSSAINSIESATSSDIGKALSPKTVADGKVTEWQYISGGGGSGEDADIKDAIVLEREKGIQTFLLHGNFQHYGLKANGTFETTQKYRVSNDDPMSFDFDMEISVASGFRWGYIPFTDDTPGTWTGWNTTPLMIPANTSFVVQIARTTEVTSEVADVNEFTDALTFKTISKSAVDILNEFSFEDSVSASFSTVDGINFGENETKYTSNGNFKVYYTSVKAGDILKVYAESTSNGMTIRFACSEDVPAIGVKGTYISQHTINPRTCGVIFVKALFDGYIGMPAYNGNLQSVSALKFTNGAICQAQRALNGVNYLMPQTETLTEQTKLLNENGRCSLSLYAVFDHYGLETNGKYKKDQKYRVSTEDIISFNHDISITSKTGFRWGYIPFVNGTPGSWSGWFNENIKTVVPSGTNFVVQIARMSENLSETADVDTFVNALALSSFIDDFSPVEKNGKNYLGNMKPTNKYMLATFASISGYNNPNGIAVTGNIIARLYNAGKILLYNLASGTELGRYDLASASADNHANSASFSNIMGTTYPLLYISECYGQHRCFIEDIDNSSSTLVQTIAFANDGINNYSGAYDWILDVKAGKIMTYGQSGDKKLIKTFALPLTTAGDITFTDSDKIDEWYPDDSAGELLNTYQGNAVYGNILYLPVYQTNRILAFDKTTHALVGKIDISTDYPNVAELEDVAIYNGKLIVSTNGSDIYQVDF